MSGQTFFAEGFHQITLEFMKKTQFIASISNTRRASNNGIRQVLVGRFERFGVSAQVGFVVLHKIESEQQLEEQQTSATTTNLTVLLALVGVCRPCVVQAVDVERQVSARAQLDRR